jgi:hypothetical protein
MPERRDEAGALVAAERGQLPPFVMRVAGNLEDEPLADFLRLTAVVVENARQFFIGVARGTDAEAEIDAIYRPWIAELWRRSLELQACGPARGNA